MFADQVRGLLPTRHFHALGTDGFGRSDTREKLRGFFEVDRNYVAVAALKMLADMEIVPRSRSQKRSKSTGSILRNLILRPLGKGEGVKGECVNTPSLALPLVKWGGNPSPLHPSRLTLHARTS